MNILFGTVFYRLAFSYLKDFINSLNNQVFTDFNVLIINDDIDEEDLDILMTNADFRYEIIHYNERYTPAGLRIKLLHEAWKRLTDVLVIGDADDVFSADRIGRIIQVSRDSDAVFFYNDIYTMDNERVFPLLPAEISNVDMIGDYNFLGMSNTAIRVSELNNDFINSLFEGDQPIFDWYLFSRIIISGGKGQYVDGAVTFYRYHENNLVGNQDSYRDNIEKEIQVKKRHYKSLSKYSSVLKRRSEEYDAAEIQLIEVQNPHFWWSFTKGGKPK